MNTPRTPGGFDVFVLLGKRYDVARMLSLAATGPTISPAIEEVDMTTNHVADQSNPEGAKNYNGAVVFYQYEGKYIVLAGYQKTVDAIVDARDDGVEVKTLKGKLLTKHNLKRCLVDDAPQRTERVIEEQIREATQKSDYARPRPTNPNSDRPSFRDRNQRY